MDERRRRHARGRRRALSPNAPRRSVRGSRASARRTRRRRAAAAAPSRARRALRARRLALRDRDDERHLATSSSTCSTAGRRALPTAHDVNLAFERLGGYALRGDAGRLRRVLGDAPARDRSRRRARLFGEVLAQPDASPTSTSRRGSSARRSSRISTTKGGRSTPTTSRARSSTRRTRSASRSPATEEHVQRFDAATLPRAPRRATTRGETASLVVLGRGRCRTARSTLARARASTRSRAGERVATRRAGAHAEEAAPRSSSRTSRARPSCASASARSRRRRPSAPAIDMLMRIDRRRHVDAPLPPHLRRAGPLLRRERRATTATRTTASSTSPPACSTRAPRTVTSEILDC